MKEKVKFSNVFKFAGAYVAFIIGAGFATGAEIMQFFTAFGVKGIIGGVISLILFSWIGMTVMGRGYLIREKIDEESVHPFDHWMIYEKKGGSTLYIIGKAVSVFFEWLTVLFLFLVELAMISGAGDSMQQHFGIDRTYGCLIMAGIVLICTLFGLRRIVDIIGSLGPLTILVTIVVALFALIKNPGGLIGADAAVEAAKNLENTGMRQGAGSWWTAGILYVAYNIAISIPFLTSVGANANSRREAKLGGLLGGVMLMASGILLTMGQLAYATDVATLEIPNLYLAQLLSPILSTIFSIILLGEIFSTAAPLLWLVCDKFSTEGSSKQKILIIFFSVAAFLVAWKVPFGILLGFIYPKMGYFGLFMIFCLILRTVVNKTSKKA